MANESSIWLGEQESCASLERTIMTLVNRRDRTQANTPPYNALTSEIHSKCKQLSSKMTWLQDGLTRASRSYQITERECDRRQKLLDNLTTKQRQIEQTVAAEHSGPTFSSNPFDAATIDNEDEYAAMTHDTFRQHQQQVIQEQDKGLDSISKVLSRQKQMALDIGNEVDTQNEILEDIIDHTDRTDSRIQSETRHIAVVDRKSGTCGFWVVIIVLFIAIICVVAIPYHKKP